MWEHRNTKSPLSKSNRWFLIRLLVSMTNTGSSESFAKFFQSKQNQQEDSENHRIIPALTLAVSDHHNFDACIMTCNQCGRHFVTERHYVMCMLEFFLLRGVQKNNFIVWLKFLITFRSYFFAIFISTGTPSAS